MRRASIAAAALAILLASGCGSTATETATRSTASRAASPTAMSTALPTLAAATSPTVEDASVVASPPAASDFAFDCAEEAQNATVSVVRDLDSDGIVDSIDLTTLEFAMSLGWCHGGGVGAGSLHNQTYVLAVIDVEQDGVSEILFGTPAVGETADAISADLELRRFIGAGLDPSLGDGFEVRPRGGNGRASGLECSDLDADGTRDLVVTKVISDPAAPEGTIPWQRQKVAIGPEDHAPEGAPVTGFYDPVADADAIDALGRATCGDDVVEFLRVGPPASVCDELETVDADVDGDQAVDRIYQRNRGGVMMMGVCFASGLVLESPYSADYEAASVEDVNGDASFEVWIGDTIGSEDVSDFGDFWTMYDDVGGKFVETGVIRFDGRAFGRFGRAGCGDPDGNGVDGPVQVTGVVSAGQLSWDRVTWEVVDGRWLEIAVDEGVIVDERVTTTDWWNLDAELLAELEALAIGPCQPK